MDPIKFDGSRPIKKPANMTDEQCTSLEIYQGITEPDGWPFTLSAWQPNAKDLENLNAGRPIWLRVLSHTVYPVSVFTMDEKNNVTP